LIYTLLIKNRNLYSIESTNIETGKLDLLCFEIEHMVGHIAG